MLNRETIKEWLEKHRWDVPETPTYDADCQTDAKLTGETETNTLSKPEKVDCGTQTEAWHGKFTEAELSNIKSYKDWNASLRKNRDWHQDMFTNTEIVTGNPLLTKDNVVKVVFVEPSDPNMDRSIQKMYRDRYPELGTIAEEFETIEQTTRIRSKDPVTTISRKIIKIHIKEEDENLWKNLQKLKDETETDSEVAIHQTSNMTPQQLQKITECVFHGTNTKVTIFTNHRAGQERNKEATRRDHNTYALVVGEEGKNYKETLSSFKNLVANSEFKSSIRNLRSTKDGKLLITTEKNKEAITTMQQKIKTDMQNAKVREVGKTNNSECIHIRGLDATAIEEDVLEAIEQKIGGSLEQNYKMSQLRPNANDTQAVTITVCKEDAKKITTTGKIRIGMVMCSVETQIRVSKCFRCWSYDHSSKECQGPDRATNCFKCGQAGHLASDCTNPEACPLCKVVGHKAGSGKCSAFRKILTLNRRRKREEEREELENQETLRVAENIEIEIMEDGNLPEPVQTELSAGESNLDRRNTTLLLTLH